MSLDLSDAGVDVERVLFDTSVESEVVIPVPSAPIRDNLAACARLLPPDSGASSLSQKEGSAGKTKGRYKGEGHLKTASWTDTVIRRSTNARANSGRRRATKEEQEARVASLRKYRPEMAAIVAEYHPAGPLDALQALIPPFAPPQSPPALVTVGIRDRGSIRGTVSGILRAFDKHLNIVLQNATETIATSGQTRTIPSLFIKGSSVIYITIPQPSSQPSSSQPSQPSSQPSSSPKTPQPSSL